MSLLRFGAEGVRNLADFVIEPASGINLISGDNGAGKTSLLEAIFFLSRGRSFRTNRLDRVRTRGSQILRVYGTVQSSIGSPISMGLAKIGRDTVARIGGGPASRLSELTRRLPVLAIGAESHRLLEDGPELRRRHIDWGVFHMEHPGLPAWRDYETAIKQRNAAIRARRTEREIRLWDDALITNAIRVTQARMDTLALTTPTFNELVKRILGDDSLTLAYRPGWHGEDYRDALDDCFRDDVTRGFTQSGPHRAEISVRRGEHSARETLSRGQQKLVVTALLLAQALTVAQRTGRAPVLLYDDLPAELDGAKREALISEIRTFPGQAFVTAIERELITNALTDAPRMFHVEQGKIRPVL